mgnify:CR=1 FL=1
MVQLANGRARIDAGKRRHPRSIVEPLIEPTAAADFGGNGSSSTWQALGTVGYRLNDSWDLVGGYRYTRYDLVDAPPPLGLGQLPQLEPEGEVLFHGHVRVEGVVLKDHRDVALAGL